jgi:hypothetical protein
VSKKPNAPATLPPCMEEGERWLVTAVHEDVVRVDLYDDRHPQGFVAHVMDAEEALQLAVALGNASLAVTTAFVVRRREKRRR